jgi:enamine deaminase RidA (YjgF/YER057c/UK114 family)
LPVKTKPAAIAEMENAGQPFSTCTQVGKHFYFSGTVSVDAEMKPVGNRRDQIDAVLDKMAVNLNACGLSFDDIVDADIYLAGDMSEYSYLNLEWMKKLDCCEVLPARGATAMAALPFGCEVEIKFMAVDQSED